MAQSAIAAAIARYGTISMSVTKPPLYFADIPQTGATGIALELPYINLVDEGTTPDYDFEHNPVEVTKVRFEAYANTLTEVDALLIGLKYGTTGATAGGGFDYCTMTITGQQFMECKRVEELRGKAGQLDKTGGYVYEGNLTYTIEASVS